MNNYQAAAAAAAQGFGPAASPHGATTAQQQRVAAAAAASFSATNSPGPVIDMYNSSAADGVGYVQAASPQPSGFPAIAVSRAPLNYSPVRRCKRFGITVARSGARERYNPCRTLIYETLKRPQAGALILIRSLTCAPSQRRRRCHDNTHSEWFSMTVI